MKRIVSLFLSLILVFHLCACSSAASDSVTFYYCRTADAYQYGQEHSVIVPEERNVSGYSGSLTYLLALYLSGPLDKQYRMPLPDAARIYAVTVMDEHVELQMTGIDESVTSADFSLACACITLTCLELTGADTVTVRTEGREITMDRNSLVLYDGGSAE